MIIWLNGAFGAGKTQTAYAPAERLDSLSHEAVVKAVAEAVGLTLLPERRGPLGRWFARVRVRLRHIR